MCCTINWFLKDISFSMLNQELGSCLLGLCLKPFVLISIKALLIVKFTNHGNKTDYIRNTIF